MTRKILTCLPLALLAAAVAAPAQAEDLVFVYRAYELDSAPGRSLVLDRLDRSVARYCGEREELRGLWQRPLAQECRDGLLDEMVGKIGDARLIALHQGRVRLAATK